MSAWDRESLAEVIGPGRKVVSFAKSNASAVDYRPPTDRVDLTLDDGRTLALELQADCCSRSYFADLKQFEELVGSTILDAEEREGPDTENDGDVMRWHFLVLKTDKGHVTIDWRNESNGYYDGELEWSIVPRALSEGSETT